MLGGFRVSFFFGAVDIINHADENEDDESNGEEINDVLNEIANGDMSGSVGAEEIWNVDREGVKIKAAESQASDRHENVIDEGINNRGESAPNGDTNREVNHIAAVDKLAEFFEKCTFFFLFGHIGEILTKKIENVK